MRNTWIWTFQRKSSNSNTLLSSVHLIVLYLSTTIKMSKAFYYLKIDLTEPFPKTTLKVESTWKCFEIHIFHCMISLFLSASNNDVHTKGTHRKTDHYMIFISFSFSVTNEFDFRSKRTKEPWTSKEVKALEETHSPKIRWLKKRHQGFRVQKQNSTAVVFQKEAFHRALSLLQTSGKTRTTKPVELLLNSKRAWFRLSSFVRHLIFIFWGLLLNYDLNFLLINHHLLVVVAVCRASKENSFDDLGKWLKYIESKWNKMVPTGSEGIWFFSSIYLRNTRPCNAHYFFLESHRAFTVLHSLISSQLPGILFWLPSSS